MLIPPLPIEIAYPTLPRMISSKDHLPGGGDGGQYVVVDAAVA